MTEHEERLAAETEPAPERPTQPPSAVEAEAAFRESQRAPSMQTLTAGPRSLRSENPLEPALAEMRGLRADIMEGFAKQAKADRATRKANTANFRIVERAVVNLRDSFQVFRREAEDRFAALEAKVAQLADRVSRQEEVLERNKAHVESLRQELEKARAARQPAAASEA